MGSLSVVTEVLLLVVVVLVVVVVVVVVVVGFGTLFLLGKFEGLKYFIEENINFFNSQLTNSCRNGLVSDQTV